MVDYFELLGLPRTYALDRALLEQRYLELSRESHPDRVAQSSADVRANAVSRSMYLNQAHRTLKRDLPRAEHLLALQGIDIGDNESVDAELLGQMLELREELAEVVASGDMAQRMELEDRARAAYKQELEQLAELFEKVEGPGDTTEVWQALKAQVIRLRYWQRYLEAFDDEEDEGAQLIS